MPRWLFLLLSSTCLFIGAGAANNPQLTDRYPLVSILFLGALFLYGTIILLNVMGKTRGLGLLLSLAFFAIVFETVALQTGFPYGAFTYTGTIGALLPGGASWTIPLGWIPLVLFSVSITQKIPSRSKRLVVGVSTLCLLDLVIDPVATAMGFWHWSEPSWYYGVPLQNFGGWLLSGALAVLICRSWIKKQTVLPVSLRVSPLLLLAFHIGAALVLKQWIPVILGSIIFLTGGRVFIMVGDRTYQEETM